MYCYIFLYNGWGKWFMPGRNKQYWSNYFIKHIVSSSLLLLNSYWYNTSTCHLTPKKKKKTKRCDINVGEMKTGTLEKSNLNKVERGREWAGLNFGVVNNFQAGITICIDNVWVTMADEIKAKFPYIKLI